MILKIPKIYLEYLHLVILLWNYPEFTEWNTSHTVYLIAMVASTIANAVYVNSMYIFMTEHNVLENYNNLLTAHIYKTIVNGIASHITAVAVYLRQYNSYAFFFLLSLSNHFMMSYLYYFGDLMYTHRYALLVKQIPHIVDIVLIIGYTEDAELQKCIFIANVCMLLSIFVKNDYAYKLFSMMETYSICEMIR